MFLPAGTLWHSPRSKSVPRDGASSPLRSGDPQKMVLTALKSMLADFNVAEGDLVPVILQQNVTFDFSAEALHGFEFAFAHRFFQFRAAQFVFQHLASIQPMLHMVSLHQYSGAIPLARFAGLPILRCKHVIE